MIVLCGKTASGKDTIMKELLEFQFSKVVTYTTRPMREGEIDGESYHFVSSERFEQLKDDGFFLETTSYNVATGETWLYGTPSSELSEDKVIIMNPDGVRVIKRHPELNPVIFYINADDGVIWNRLRQRGDSAAEADRRLKSDESDFSDIDKYWDYAIRNTDVKPNMIARIIFTIYSLHQLFGGEYN